MERREDNVARHASAAAASVRIDHRPDTLLIRVYDDGRAAPATAPPPGVGLLGMRERVTAPGGRLRAAPRSEGGLTVQAELPRGLSNDQVAERMVISPLTAKTHVNRAMTKLHARDRAQLVVLAYESGLVAPRDS